MPIPVTCECGQHFETRDENAGRRAKCPDCGRELIVPDPAPLLIDEFTLPQEKPATATSGKAIASLTLGFCFFCLAVTGIPAIILGRRALGEINRSDGRLKGSGMAHAGIVMGTVSSLLMLPALLLPATRSAREAARRAQCVNNLKQIGLALHNYHDTYNVFPPAAITDKQNRPLLSWRVAILPSIEQNALYAKFHLDEPWDSPRNLALLDERPGIYACPSDKVLPKRQTTYLVFVDPRSMFTPDFKPVTMAGVLDGTAYTILVGEARHSVPWTAPEDLPFDMTIPQSGLDSYHSFHSGGFNVLFADGSVKFLKPTIAPKVFGALVTRDGGEVISAESY